MLNPWLLGSLAVGAYWLYQNTKSNLEKISLRIHKIDFQKLPPKIIVTTAINNTTLVPIPVNQIKGALWISASDGNQTQIGNFDTGQTVPSLKPGETLVNIPVGINGANWDTLKKASGILITYTVGTAIGDFKGQSNYQAKDLLNIVFGGNSSGTQKKTVIVQ